MRVQITGFGIDGAGLADAFISFFVPDTITLGSYTVTYAATTLATLGSSTPTLAPTALPVLFGQPQRFEGAPRSVGACSGTVYFNADLPSQATGSFKASLLQKYDNNADCHWKISASYARHGLTLVHE